MAADLIIGKNGLNISVYNEIKKQLKRHKTIKLKFLKSFIQDKDRKKLAQEIATECKAQLGPVVGFTLVLKKI